MNTTEMRHQGTYSGLGIFTNRQTGRSLEVNYRIEKWQDFIPYRDGLEVARKIDLIGTIWPFPEDVLPPFPSGPHTLELNDKRALRCFIQNDSGDVKCS
jgi:hypothetical protein